MDYERALVGMAKARPSTKSEVARFSECTGWYAQKVLDTADIVRDAMFHQTTNCPIRLGMRQSVPMGFLFTLLLVLGNLVLT